MAEKDAYKRERDIHHDLSTQRVVATSDTTITDLITPRSTAYQIYVQRILVNITTAAAQNWSFQDDADTPVSIAKVPNSQAVGLLEFDFGAKGYPLTLAKNLDLSISGAGVGATVAIEAYERLGTVVAHNSSLV